MRNSISRSISNILLMSFVIMTSCNSQSKTGLQKTKTDNTEAQQPQSAAQIAQYVVEIFEDSKGNLWFGTIEKGCAKYDAKKLTYYTTEDGLIGNTVTSFAED